MIRPDTVSKMREYKLSHTNGETREAFCVSESTVRKYCKGIEPQKQREFYHSNQHNVTKDREEYAKEKVAECQPGYEYVGGYTNSDGLITLRCKNCGKVFERSFQSVRKRTQIKCEGCESIERAKKEAEQKRIKEERKAERDAKKAEEEAARLHNCIVCGRLTTRRKYCSKRCADKQNNSVKEIRRRHKIEGATVDRGINLEQLYLMDDGRCYLCGGRCDWNDKEVRSTGTVICGNSYPSIDHVVPLSVGGKHEWSNVRLAHRICNSRKGNFYAPLVENF